MSNGTPDPKAPWSAADWAKLIGAIVIGLTSLISSITSAVVSIRNGQSIDQHGTILRKVEQKQADNAEKLSAIERKDAATAPAALPPGRVGEPR